MHGHKPTQKAIEDALEIVLASTPFTRSAKQIAFLRFVVGHNLNNVDSPPSSFEIAIDCFKRSPSDPNDAYVRNIASQTRKSLKSYYGRLPQPPDVVIQLAEKGYQTTYEFNAAETASTTPEPTVPSSVVTQKTNLKKLLPTIAVTPLRCVSGDNEHAVLGLMLSDSLITSLARSNYMRVISRRTSTLFKLSEHSAVQLGEKLNVDYLINGRFHVHRGELLVQAELSSCSNGEVIWSDQLRSNVGAVVAETDNLVDQILIGVTNHLLNHELQRALSTPLASLQCHSLLIGSINIMHRGITNDVGRALEMLTLLSQRNPLHAAPYAYLAYLGALDNIRDADHGEPDISRRFVQENATKSLSIDSQHPIALTAHGAIKSHFEGDFVTARHFYEQAIRYSPNEAATMGKLAVAQLYTESSRAAYKTTTHAIQTSPYDPELYFFHAVAAAAAFGDEEYELAIKNAELSRKLFPEHPSNLRTLIGSYSALGQHRESTQYRDQLLAIDPTFNLESYRSKSPFPNNEIIMRLTKYLRQSGLPSNIKDKQISTQA